MDKSPQFWAFWGNPILHRYRRSRLRASRMIPWSICVVILATFIFLLPYTSMYYRFDRGNALLAARFTLIPLLVFQGLILMVKGTFSIAAGITQESTEGILDYQRLTPTGPMTKIVGYLFGLPLREYFLFFLTLPFTGYAAVVGEIPLGSVLEVYAVFFSATLLYHMTGFFSGMVVKKKILAGVLSQVMILVIYWLLPNLSFVGYTVFEFLTLYPVVYEKIGELHPQLIKDLPRLKDHSAYFYSWKFSPAPFSIAIQLSLAGLFGVVIYRKWRDRNHHLLGKYFTVGVYGVLIAVLLGTTMPLIQSGLIFVSKMVMEMEWGHVIGGTAIAEEAFFATILFGLFSSVAAIVMIWVITPTLDVYRNGIHRMRKLGQRIQPTNADSSTGVVHGAVIVFLGAVGWLIFTQAISQSTWISDLIPFNKFGLGMFLGFFVPVVVCQLILENLGKRGFFMWLVFMWVLPVFTGIIVAIVSPEKLTEISIYISSLSGFSLLLYSASAAYDLDLYGYENIILNGLRLGILFQMVIGVIFMIRLFVQKRTVIKHVDQGREMVDL